MYATIRRYRTDRGNDATRRASRQFVHSLKQLPGFVSWTAVESADEWVTVTVFQTKQQAERADQLAAEFVLRDGVDALLGTPEVVGGEVGLHVA
ncbi:MAG TPA: hypothetical protein VF796_02925 [Humisphaera sp.]